MALVRFASSLLFPALALLPGCFWGDVEGGVTFTVTSRNVDQYVDLLYPTAKMEAWRVMFEDRPTLCPPDDEGCDADEQERSDELDFFLRYEATRVRGLLTQKGDLQVTSHLDVGEAITALSKDGYDDWAYMTRTDRLVGLEGDGCDSSVDPESRTGVGRCVFAEIEANEGEYKALGEDVRLVLVINLPDEDDVRSVQCQDGPRTFASTDWEYPRTLLVNYDATGPVEAGDDTRYGTDADEPLPQCEIEVFSQLSVASQVFAGDFFGEGVENADLTIEEARDETSTPLVGSVVLESLSLPGEDGEARAKGTYSLAFTSSRFSERDGSVAFEGSFDVEVRRDPEQVEDPDRSIDLDPEAEAL